MSLIQVDFPDDLTKKLKIEKAKRDLNNLNETVIAVIREYFKVSKK